MNLLTIIDNQINLLLDKRVIRLYDKRETTANFHYQNNFITTFWRIIDKRKGCYRTLHLLGLLGVLLNCHSSAEIFLKV